MEEQLKADLETEFYTACLAKLSETELNLINGAQISKPFLTGDDCRFQFNETNYEGSMTSNEISGLGTLNTPTFQYTGTFVRNLFEGHGQLSFDCNTYVGDFHEGFPDGHGNLWLSDEGYFCGMFKAGRKVSGKRKYHNGVFQGKFDEINQTRKEGLYTWNDSTYFGEFKDGLPHGLGNIWWDSAKFKGRFQNGRRNGVGRLKWNQVILMTVWKNDIKDGPGLFMAANGDFFSSCKMFTNNEFDNSHKIELKPLVLLKIRKILMSNDFDAEKFYVRVHELFKFAQPNALKPFLYHEFDVDLEFMKSFLLQQFPDCILYQQIESLKRAITEKFFEIRDVGVKTRFDLWKYWKWLGMKPVTLIDAEKDFNILVFNPNNSEESVRFPEFLKYILHPMTVVVATENNQKLIEDENLSDAGKLFKAFFRSTRIEPEENKNLQKILKLYARIKEPGSIRTFFHVVAGFQGRHPMFRELTLKVNAFEKLTLQDVSAAVRDVVHGPCEDPDPDIPIDGIDFYTVMEKLIVLGLKKLKIEMKT